MALTQKKQVEVPILDNNGKPTGLTHLITMWYQKRSASIHPVTFIETDQSITGVNTEGDKYTIMNVIRPKLIGRDPFDIEKMEANLGGAIRGRWEMDSLTLADAFI